MRIGVGIGMQSGRAAPTVQEERYLFIDGAYLRKQYEDQCRAHYQREGKLSLSALRGRMHAKKAFFYDCFDELKRPGESDEDYSVRCASQQAYVKEIRQLDGHHFREGRLVGTEKKRRQKEIDVLLAVEMMHHAFRGNMTHACLIAGDGDFKPLVDSLIDLGTWVEVRAFRRHVSEELIAAADAWSPLLPLDMWVCSDEKLRHDFPQPPTEHNSLAGDSQMVQIAEGTIQGENVLLFKGSNGVDYFLHFPSLTKSIVCRGKAQLERYLEVEFGPITWSGSH